MIWPKFYSGIRGEPRDLLWLDEPKVKTGYIASPEQSGFGATLNEVLL